MSWRALCLILALCWAVPCGAGWIFDGEPSTWEGIPDELKADEFTYPALRLELGGQWTDFELKASTNNFQSLVYCVVSSSTNGTADDTNVWVYFTDDYSPDVREWHRATNAVPIASQLADATNSEVEVVYVYPSHDAQVGWSGWMSRTNSRLVWSYVRFDSLAFEMNATGTRQHWNPVQPVMWSKGRTAP